MLPPMQPSDGASLEVPQQSTQLQEDFRNRAF